MSTVRNDDRNDDQRFNGIHVCPRCGCKSLWKSVSASTEGEKINVKCDGDCGEYVMSHAQLSGYPKFKENA